MFAIAGPEAAPGGTAERPTYNTRMRACRPHRQEPPQARLSSNGTSIQALGADATQHRVGEVVVADDDRCARGRLDLGQVAATGRVVALVEGFAGLLDSAEQF